MAEDMSHWTQRPKPPGTALQGRLVRLEKLAPSHGAGLYAASAVANAPEKFRWLYETPPQDQTSFQAWVQTASASADPLFYAVIDKASGAVAGRESLMRIDAANGVIEVGNIYWGPLMAAKAQATEALSLFAAHVFEDLGYRRFE